MSEKLLFAGPWVGEFGWELFCWQAYIRSLSKFYDKTVCVSSAHSKFLYDDFCDHFVEFDPEEGEYKDSYYKVGLNITKDLLQNLMMKSDTINSQTKVSVFVPRRIGDPPRTHFTEEFTFGKHTVKPLYKKYGTKREEYKDFIVIHARSRIVRPEDNWSKKNWTFLVDSLRKMGYTNIVSIGLKSQSLHIDGTIDFRESEQEELLDLLASAKCIFGPSSGAIHLASLCGCPQVVWSTDYNLVRYTKNWNPFETKVLFLSEQGWQPDPQHVLDRFEEWIHE